MFIGVVPWSRGVAAQNFAPCWRQIFAGQREGEIGLEKSQLVAAIEPPPLEAQGVEGMMADQAGHGVGQLDLATGAAFLALQFIEDFRYQDVAADDSEVGRCLVGRGFSTSPRTGTTSPSLTGPL